MTTPWKFYGRTEELDLLSRIFDRGRWFFLKVSGRRRIGKTALVQEALKRQGADVKQLYIQIPDSDPSGVLATVNEYYSMFNIRKGPPSSLFKLARSLGELIREGYIITLDEFQYFNRKPLYEFTSHLQYEVDQLSSIADKVNGGLIVLGSIHTEMEAILDDRSAPLFNRVTDQIDLPHLDIASVLEIIRAHAACSPEKLLFLWNLFEGVPKYYRDCYEQDLLNADRKVLLERMFFAGSSSLKSEADNWFLRELRGKTDLILKYIAQHPGCSSSNIKAHVAMVDPANERNVEAYIRILIDRYLMVERLQPVFAARNARKGRMYVRDNFLRSWLSAIAKPVSVVNFRSVEDLLEESDGRLKQAEGYGLERLVWKLYEERSRKKVGDFPLTSRMQGYWDRADTEIDLVALNEDDKVLRLGTCKRNAEQLAYASFDGHVGRFLEAFPKLKSWKVEKTAIAPLHTKETRKAAEDSGYIAQDLFDLTKGL
jgi:AAA+ ATPase superfamily predicted ATPase